VRSKILASTNRRDSAFILGPLYQWNTDGPLDQCWNFTSSFSGFLKSAAPSASACGNYCSSVTAIFCLNVAMCMLWILITTQPHTLCALGDAKYKGGPDEGAVRTARPARTANRRVAFARLRQCRNRKPAKNGASNCEGAFQPVVSPFRNHRRYQAS
jgi:hypothetical protein